MAKGKWKGLDLVRKDTSGDDGGTSRSEDSTKNRGAGLLREGASPAPAKPPAPKRDPFSQLGRIRTRRVLRGPDGEVFDLTERIPVWLVQIDDINQIFISDVLKSGGYDVVECARLDQLIAQLDEAEDNPKLIIAEARVVGQQTPFFRKMILPKLQALEVPCLLTGVASEAQESSFRSWYEGPMLVGGDLDDLSHAVHDLIGPGAK